MVAGLADRLSLPITVLDDGAMDDEHRLGAIRDLAWSVRAQSLGSGSLVIAAGDNLFKCAISEFVEAHRQRPRNLVLRYREPDLTRLRRTGVAQIDADGRLLRLVEKPQKPPSEWAIPALYALEPTALALLDSFIVEFPEVDPIGNFIAWLAEREPVFTHEMRGERLDVGDLASYRLAESWLANDHA